MNNVKKLAVVFALFSFVSCMDEDISRINNSIEIQPNLAIPIINSTTTLVDILPEDENMTFDNDGFIRIVYKEDSIAQVSSDTLLVIDDQNLYITTEKVQQHIFYILNDTLIRHNNEDLNLEINYH